MRLLVGAAVLEALEGMSMQYPKVTKERTAELKGYREQLVGEDG